jgi:carbon-monoxide dehydrogenase large subunit
MLGESIPRLEDARFLSGSACFVDDLQFPGMLHAVVVRSAQAHALIKGIGAEAVRKMPGVHAVFTFADIAKHDAVIPLRLGPLPGFERYLQRPLARERVRFVGEPVALVVAADRYVAEDAAEALEIEYQPLAPVVRAQAGMKDESLVHPEVGTNIGTHYTVAIGNVAEAFARAKHRRKASFHCHRHSAVPMETRGLVVVPQGNALELWGATKVNFQNRRALSQMLGVPVDKIAMIETDVGGSFGVRGEFYPEDFLIPFAARELGRPVKWIEDRREHLIAANHSREIDCELELALDAQGRLLGLRAKLVADMGAYVRTNGSVVPAKTAQFLPGPYRIANFECEVIGVMTNKTPVGTYRAPGRYEANFFRERLFDLACAEFGFDPAEFRRRNLIAPHEMPYGIGKLVPYEPPSEYDGGDYPALFDRALEEFGYRDLVEGAHADGRLHGVGMACFVESSGAGPAETARVVLKGAARFEVYVGSSSSGQGHETSMAQILAGELGVPLAGIRVFHGSTSFVPNGFGTYHSRAIVMGGSAILLAARKLAGQLVARAAAQHGLPAAQLELRDGNVYAKGASRALLDLDACAGEEAMATFEQAKRTYTYGTHLAHVAVDPETARVEVLRYLSVEDIGRAVNPLIVHGQAIGAAVQGLGATFLDEFKYGDDGQLLTGTLADYLLPLATDFPSVEALTLENSPSKLNPLGVKGAGEGGIVAVGGAVANAVARALAPLGVEITDLPLSPDNLSAAIRKARGKFRL